MSIDIGPSKFPTYEIRKIGDILAIPADRLDDFLANLKEWHKLALETKDLIEVALDHLDVDISPSDFVTKLVWTDDGKDHYNIILTRDTVE